MRPRVLVTRRIPDEGLALVMDHCDTRVWPHDDPPTHADLLREVPGIHGLLCLLSDRVDDAVLAAAGPSLRVVSVMAVGYDNVDVAAATRRGVVVTHTPGALTETTADLAFALLLAAARRIPEGVDTVRAGRWKSWDPLLLLGEDVHGATLGIVGMGRIGQAVARRARGFDMRVLHFNRSPVQVPDAEPCSSLLDLARRSDFVTLHVPGAPENRHVIGRDFLAAMKPSAILVNTARGTLLDTDALVEALRAHRIRAAALDVTDPEPLPPDHPLLGLSNCLVVPHIGSASRATRAAIARLAAQNLVEVLAGRRPPHPVNPETLAPDPPPEITGPCRH